jgi:FkbM family methyltransferase
VIAFEPVPGNRRILLWNLKLNDIQNVIVRSEALAESNGMATIKLSRGPSAESLVREFHKSGELRVHTVSLDSLRLEKLDLAKIDVEGAELNVLRGARETVKTFRPRMQIEVHSPHGEGCGVCNWLEDMEYSVRVIYQKKVRTGQIHWVDAGKWE